MFLGWVIEKITWIATYKKKGFFYKTDKDMFKRGIIAS